jgi:hypothetical protein
MLSQPINGLFGKSCCDKEWGQVLYAFLNRPEKRQAKAINKDTLKNERNRNYEISRIDRFMYRSRYFTDSGIIGTKEFVSINYQRFKGVFMSKREKIPKPISGLDGVYSLKRLAE